MYVIKFKIIIKGSQCSQAVQCSLNSCLQPLFFMPINWQANFYWNVLSYFNCLCTMKCVHLSPPLPLWQNYTQISLYAWMYLHLIWISSFGKLLSADFIALLRLNPWTVERWKVEQKTGWCHCEIFTFLIVRLSPIIIKLLLLSDLATTCLDTT